MSMAKPRQGTPCCTSRLTNPENILEAFFLTPPKITNLVADKFAIFHFILLR